MQFMIRTTVIAFLLFPLVALGELPAAIDHFLAERCFDCHDDASTKGELDLTALDFDPSSKAWIRVHDRIEKGEMPPKDKPATIAD